MIQIQRRTDSSVRFWRTGGELENVCSLLPQTPAVQDLSIILLKVIKLQRVGGVQQPADRKWHHSLSQFCSLKLLPQVLTSCSYRAAHAPLDLCNPGCHSDHQGRTLPMGCVQNLFLQNKNKTCDWLRGVKTSHEAQIVAG